MTENAELQVAAPDVYQMTYQNPQASEPLIIPVAVVCNTDEAQLYSNIHRNTALDALPWVSQGTPAAFDDQWAVLVGGGPSMADYIPAIEALREAGCPIFAMNGAATYLAEHGIIPTYQVIADAKQETSQLVEPRSTFHLIASQCHPDTVDRAMRNMPVSTPRLWHLMLPDMEKQFPDWRVATGGYVLVGGGAAVGNSALALAFAMGYRKFKLFGYDSSNADDGATHAYPQPMNRFQPLTTVEWAGRTFTTSLAMKAQAEKFQLVAQQLVQQGCKIDLYGDGLLPTMWLTEPTDLTERDKYRSLWRLDTYRKFSPGEHLVEYAALHYGEPDPQGLVIDFGCGTGRAMLKLAERGYNVLGIDFADNCRDPEAKRLPFLEWDLTEPTIVRGTHGLCTDVLEHIPQPDVDDVIRNIMQSVPSCVFSISTVEDEYGSLIRAPLHLTVKSADWWKGRFERLGYRVPTCLTGEGGVLLIAERGDPSDE